jgi:Small subunit of serine palmitoyltransferase-like
MLSFELLLCRLYRYNLYTAVYMLEPWERALFNSIFFAVIAYIAYSMHTAAVYPLYERLTASHM